MSELRALVSIGTNSTRVLVVDGDDTVEAASVGTRLGTGIAATGHLDSDAIARTLAAIANYMVTIRARDALVDSIATSVMRRASDGEAFAARVGALVGIAPRVLSGDEEAAYSFLGATRRGGGSETVGVLDVGGGSTELAADIPAHARAAGRVARTISLEVGAVRLAERQPALLGERALDGPARAAVLAEARADAASVLAPLAAFAGLPHLIAVGGTAFTAASMVALAALRDGVEIGAADRAALLETLLGRDLEARKTLPFIRPQRADILPAGIIVIDEACRLVGIDRVRVSVDDLLAGYLYSAAYRPCKPSPGLRESDGQSPG